MSIVSEAEFAEQLARWMHRDHIDKSNKPYIGHLERVAASVSDDAKAAAWLHDVVEDTSLGISAIVQMFSVETADAVHLLTRITGRETYREYITRIATAVTHGAAIAKEVKIADIKDNLSPERRYDGDESIRKRYYIALEILGE